TLPLPADRMTKISPPAVLQASTEKPGAGSAPVVGPLERLVVASLPPEAPSTPPGMAPTPLRVSLGPPRGLAFHSCLWRNRGGRHTAASPSTAPEQPVPRPALLRG